MGKTLYARARTTPKLRRETQNSQENLVTFSKDYGVSSKTTEKWQKKDFDDVSMEPKMLRSRSLSQVEEALVVAFRFFMRLPLDDCLHSLRKTIPHLTRSSLHRCLQRYGISRLPKETIYSERKEFTAYFIGYFYVDIIEVQTEEGGVHFFTAIDRISKFAYAQLHTEMTRTTIQYFLECLITNVPYEIHTVLTDNGIHSINREQDVPAFTAFFGQICHKQGIEHRLTDVRHPWTNGQVEQMNRAIKEAVIGRYHLGSRKELEQHLHAFLMEYNLASRLNVLKGNSPYDFIRAIRTTEPERFTINPGH